MRRHVRCLTKLSATRRVHVRSSAAAFSQPTALIFPGQGSQRVGVLRGLVEEFPYVKAIADDADSAVGYALSDIANAGADDVVAQSENAQPIILTHAVAVWAILKHECELDIAHFTAVTGHSLGEYTALSVNAAFDTATAVSTVHRRGLLMSQAMRTGRRGAMAALLPCAPQTAEDICTEAAAASGLICVVANYNSPQQQVISGDADAVNLAVNIARTSRGVKRAVMLHVSAPFHSPLMTSAQRGFSEFLQEITLNVPTIAHIANVSGRTVRSVDEIRCALIDGIVAAVQWTKCIETALAMGVRQFIECGPSTPLSSLVTAIATRQKTAVTCHALSSAKDIRNFISKYRDLMRREELQ